ncbi:LacI family transcriptional regulator [Streptomyces sp. NBC_00322]|uniref:LacI family DNA-binding transcriptional regulator n=1 Tax=Streptomyces sp. NBC_00322 TaxID=2975712 RepID=UPI002E2DFB81|nr:LacI family DNA-binding transcriptional regulator [Streptomyces sp. NBC_00322]
MPRVTLSDVAAACGMSKATVSLVVRDSPRVSVQTRARVRAAMEQLGYVYDRRAANLRAARSMTVALVATNVRNPYFAELTMAIERVLYKRGYTLLLGYSHDDRERQTRLLGAMSEHRVDGVLLVPSYETSDAMLQKSLGSSGTPHVLVARHVPRHQADYIGVDNRAAGQLLGDHLARSGRRHVAFLGGPPRSTARVEREQGLRTALEGHGLGLDPALSIATSADRGGGERAVELLGETGRPYDAIVCYSDVVAFGAISALRARGMEPGREVAVAGFDDVPDATLQHPSLTTVATHPDQTGAEAAELLLRRIEEPDLPPRTVLLTPELKVRESTRSQGGPTGIGPGEVDFR